MKIKNAFAKPFCVYAHIIGRDIIYIGSGSMSRAFSINRSDRWEQMTRGKRVAVQILALFDDGWKARDYEGRLIDYHRPPG